MRFLLVEDEEKFWRITQEVLESESFAVDWCKNGESGLSRALVESYDLAIVDLGLPGMSGLEVIQRLRDRQKHIPVLVLTALGQVKDKVTGLNLGADDYVVKPVSFDELIARIRSILRRPAQIKSTTYTCDTLTLDATSRRVTRSGKEVVLSLKEFALLEYLLRNQDIVVSRQSIIDHVWDESLDPFSNTVDVHIGYLRNKIDRQFPGESQLIKTVKGVGYKIEA